MDEILAQHSIPNQRKDFKNNSLLIILIILVSFVLVGVGVLIGLNLSKSTKQVSIIDTTMNQVPTTIPTQVDIVAPTTPSTPTPIPTTPLVRSTLTPTPTATIDEIALVRKLIANFEKFNAVKNTAGCLDFFTPAVTSDDKAKLLQILSTNLPYSISSWRFGASDDRYLLNKKADNLYQVIMVEIRDKISTNLIVEVTRIGDDFLIDRYYEAGQTSGNLKYQGFKL